jgi:hypothetical protein
MRTRRPLCRHGTHILRDSACLLLLCMSNSAKSTPMAPHFLDRKGLVAGLALLSVGYWSTLCSASSFGSRSSLGWPDCAQSRTLRPAAVLAETPNSRSAAEFQLTTRSSASVTKVASGNWSIDTCTCGKLMVMIPLSLKPHAPCIAREAKLFLHRPSR